MIAVVDYGVGNLRSVAKALESVGADALIAERPAQLADAERILLPGVGAFGSGIAALRELGFAEALEVEVRQRHKPLLGICLGMQLLAEESDEGGRFTGLGWLPGRVEALPSGPAALRSPHMGWNDIAPCEPTHALLRDLGKSRAFYFAHSYHVRLREGAPGAARVIARCDYGLPIAAGIVSGNVAGFQFHPEKSQEAGLRLLRNFVDWSVAP